MNRLSRFIGIVGIVALLVGCGGGSSSTGRLDLQMTDTKVDEALAVAIYYKTVQIHSDNNDFTIDVKDPLTGNPGRYINLLDYSNGASAQLFDEELPAGHYSWMRLMIDLDLSYIELADGQHPLVCSSCLKNGLKLNHAFTIDADQTTALTLDFDLRSSITFDNTRYHLRPTVRVIQTQSSGSISGMVDPTQIANNDPDGNGCAVYVFDDYGATLDDVYMPTTGTVPVDHNNPVTTTLINPTSQTYTTAFLPPANYSVALTCDPDKDITDIDEVVGVDMAFVGSQDATVTSGMTTTVDFN